MVKKLQNALECKMMMCVISANKTTHFKYLRAVGLKQKCSHRHHIFSKLITQASSYSECLCV